MVEAAAKCKGGEHQWVFAGHTASFEDFELTDMWDGPAVQRFTGISVSFARDVQVQTRAEEILEFSDDLTFSIEIRISSLGNHYVRMQRRLNDASVHDLNQAMRRATRQMGDERVTFGPLDSRRQEKQPEWQRLTDLAEELIDSVVNRLEPGKKAPPRKGQPHIIVTARKVSIERVVSDQSDRFRRDISVEDLSKAKGAALLVQPVRQAAAVLEEWCYSPPDFNDEATIRPLSFVGDFAHRTTNTTCGLLRGIPEYLLMEHEEAAELIASLPVLLENWMGQILDHAHTADMSHRSSADLLNQRQLELRELLSKATRVIAEIHSPELCLTAVHREYLDEMFTIRVSNGSSGNSSRTLLFWMLTFKCSQPWRQGRNRRTWKSSNFLRYWCGARRRPLVGRTLRALRRRFLGEPNGRHDRGSHPEHPDRPALLRCIQTSRGQIRLRFHSQLAEAQSWGIQEMDARPAIQTEGKSLRWRIERVRLARIARS